MTRGAVGDEAEMKHLPFPLAPLRAQVCCRAQLHSVSPLGLYGLFKFQL